mgnify:CR=1 FL=1
MEKRKVHFDIIIPNELDIGEVIIYKSLPDKKREEMHPGLIEDFEHGYNTCPEDEDCDDHDDPDWQPGIDESDEDPDPYEFAPLTEDEKAMLKQELQNLILDQECDLDLEWQEYQNEND